MGTGNTSLASLDGSTTTTLEPHLSSLLSAVENPATLDLNGLTKVAMHSAAERAKARRQEEEAEREKERERARAKAAEIEVKMKQAEEARERERKAQLEKEAAEAERKRLAEVEETKRLQAAAEAEAKARQEEAERQERERQLLETQRLQTQAAHKPDPLIAKAPSTSRPKLQLQPRTLPIPPIDTPVDKPLARTLSHPSTDAPSETVTSAFTQPGSAVAEVIQALEDKRDGDMDVIEYTDMVDAFIESAVAPKLPLPTPDGRPKRPVALDFAPESPSASYPPPKALPPHTGTPTGTSPNEDLKSWRRVASQSSVGGTAVEAPKPEPSSYEFPHSPSHSVLSPSTSLATLHVPSSTPRGPLTPPAHRDGNASYPSSSTKSFADAMSRIKSAIVDTQAQNSSSLVLMPPELFAVSRLTRPVTPSGDPRAITVKLSRQPRRTVLQSEPLKAFKARPQKHGWEILTWDPPIANMSRVTLSRDELYVGGKNRVINVKIPKAVARGPKVRLPTGGGQPSPALQSTWSARGTGMEDSSWRKNSKEVNTKAPLYTIPEVNAVTRSPPPVVFPEPAAERTTIQVQSAEITKDDFVSPPTSARGKNKLPFGTDVAFYRVVEGTVPDPAAAASHVRFTVTSEVDEAIDDAPSNSFHESTSDGKATDETVSQTVLFSSAMPTDIVYL